MNKQTYRRALTWLKLPRHICILGYKQWSIQAKGEGPLRAK